MGKHYRYETVKGDPLNTRIYELKNGLKVFLSVYKDTPRIQTYIAVHTGSKMDPPETTGLAHYFEHMMFKGTENFGTLDWKQESNLLQKIEDLFEEYRNEKNEERRSIIFREIDSLSYQASLLAIPNEYDKLMDWIGAQGSNAGTSNDYTIFMENIPSGQVENWARIQSERFSRPVLRLFHTELETVYEEKNMSLTNDYRKVNETSMQILFPDHPYGTQTTLGEPEHLKNPSMKKIREFFAKYYVPNNMAICMSGDLDPDRTIELIDTWFGSMKPMLVSPLKYKAWKPLTAPVEKEIIGLEAENLRISYGFDIRANQDESLLLIMTSSVLYNGKAGLIDKNLNQLQKVLSASAFDGQLADYGMILLSGVPKSDQSLDEVRDLMFEQVALLKKGDFPEWLPEAIVNNTRYDLLKQYESNQGRATAISQAYLNDIPYSDFIAYIDKLERINKDDIIAFAKNYLNNPVIIYKRQGIPEEIHKVTKPPITPIHINGDSESAFLREIKKTKVAEVEPEFIDYSKDLDLYRLSDSTRILYKANRENDTFQLVYYYKMGKNHDKKMNFALTLLPFLGTSKHTVDQVNERFFRLACSFQVISTDEETTLSLTGLSKNTEAALELMEELLTDAIPDQPTLDNFVENTLKTRIDGKANQNEVFSALVSYGIYGSTSPYTHILSEDELRSLKAAELVQKIKDLRNVRHDVLYYGDATPGVITGLLEKYHATGSQPVPVPAPVVFREMETTENKVLFAPYDAKQAKIQTLIKGKNYDRALAPVIALFNLYFGGNIVFQELREKRALAYTATSRYQEPTDLTKAYLNKGYIATQNDKVMDALEAFDDLFNEPPLSESTLNSSKIALLNKISTERIHRMSCIWNFLNAEKLGLTEDIRKDIFGHVPALNLNDMKRFGETYLKNKAKTYLILGRESEIDFTALGKVGIVTRLSLKDLFGY